MEYIDSLPYSEVWGLLLYIQSKYSEKDKNVEYTKQSSMEDIANFNSTLNKNG